MYHNSFSEETLQRAAAALDQRERTSGIGLAPLPIDDPKGREARFYAARYRVADKAATKIFRAECERFERLLALVRLMERPAEAISAYRQLEADGITLPDALVESWVYENRAVDADGKHPRVEVQMAAWRVLCADSAKRTEPEYRRCITAAIDAVQADSASLTKYLDEVGAKYGVPAGVRTVTHNEVEAVADFLRADASRDWTQRITSCSLGMRHELQRYCDSKL